jgi:serine/threonine protein kinase/WD40 repeat protein
MIQSAPSASAVAADQELAELVDRLTEQLAAGEAIDLDSLAAEHPQYADRLRALLPALQTLVEIGGAPSGAVGNALRGAASSVPLPLGEGGSRSEPGEGSSGRRSPSSAPFPLGGRSEPGEGLGTLGDFRLVREIGRGGMGIVYEAEQLSLRRRVALKILPLAGMLDERALTRFRNEAQAAASLDHSHIVDVLGVGCDHGMHFYAMRLIDGCTLADVIAELRSQESGTRSQESEPVGNALRGVPESADNPALNLEPETLNSARHSTAHAVLTTLGLSDTSRRSPDYYRKIASLIADAADALHHAHEQGVIHRDIKPSNLMLDSRGKLWVTDFGLAHVESNATLTKTGDLMGTLRYMSPEQASGSRLGIDHRTDIYSLGVTLFELLTLQPPFTGENRAEVLQQIVGQELRVPRDRARFLPWDLVTIAHKATEKRRTDRYSDAKHLADDLRRFLEQRPITVRSPSLAVRVVKWTNRNRALARGMTAVAVVAALAMAIGAVLVSGERAKLAYERKLRVEQESLAAQRAAFIEEREYVANVSLAAHAWRKAEIDRARQYLLACVPSGDRADQRGVEWRYLWRQVHSVPEPVARHEGKAFAATFSPDGRLLATAGEDGARIWDSASILNGTTAPAIQWLRPSVNDINSVGFSPNGRWLATGGDDSTVRIWDAATWKQSREFVLPHDVRIVRFSPDGKLLAAVEYDNDRRGLPEGPRARIWRTSDWIEVRWPKLVEVPVNNLAFSPDGIYCAVGCFNGELRILRVDEGEEVSREYYADAVRTVGFHPRTALVVAGRNSGQLSFHFLTHPNNEIATSLTRHDSRVESVAFAGTGSWFATASMDHTARVWATSDAERVPDCTHVFPHPAHVWGAEPSPDGKHLVTVANDGLVRCFRLHEPQDVRHIVRDAPWWARHLSFLPDGRLLVGGHRELRELIVGNAEDRPFGEASEAGLTASPDGRYVATAEYTGDCALWDARSGALIRTWSKAESGMFTGSASFGAGGRVLALARIDAAPLFVEPATGRQMDSPLAPAEMADTIQFSTDGRFLAVQRHARLRVFVWPRGHLVHEAENAGKFAFSPDSQLFAQVAESRINVTSTVDWSLESTIPVYALAIDDLAISRDSRTLVLATPAGVRLFHIATGLELMSLPGGGAQKVAFSRDGRILAACKDQRQVLIWHLDAAPSGGSSPPAAEPYSATSKQNSAITASDPERDPGKSQGHCK